MHPGFANRLIRNFVPAALFIVALGSVFYAFESSDDLKELINHESDHVHAGVETTNRILIELERDTQYLARSSLLTDAVARTTPATVARAAQDMAAFVATKRIYHKVRWLDESGRELARADLVDGESIVVPPDRTGSKSARYYFAQAMKLRRGETYLSPLDLDFEKGKLELPPNPTLRAATPLFDPAGRRRGIAVISYSAQDLFDRIDSVSATGHSTWMLLNDRGYWLKGRDRAQEFGFMLPHRAGMAAEQPDIWNKIAYAPSGHFFDKDGGLWLFDTIYPHRAIAGKSPQHDPEAGRLKMVKHIDATQLGMMNKSLRQQVMLLVFFVLALAFAVSIRLSRSQLEQEHQQIDLQHLLGELNQQKFALDQHAIVAVTDLNGDLTYVNDKFCAISQYSRQELLGQNHRIVKSGVQSPKFYRDMFATIAAGRVWHGEMCNRAKDGSLYWVMNTLVPMLNANGKPETYVAISTDITAAKLHEQRLEEAQRLGKIGHWQLDLVSGRLDWSNEVFRIFEIDPHEFGASYETFLSLVHPEDRGLVERSYADAVANHGSYDIQHRLLFADGRVKWLSERGMTHYDRDGKALVSVGTVQDITVQKEAEEKLRIASIAFETQEAIVVTDAQARIISVNRSFERLTGYSAAEALGQNPRILQSGKHGPEFYKKLWDSLREHGTWSGEMWDKRKDGTIYPKWLTITSVRDDAGDITHYVAIFMDISERKRAEEEIQRLAFYDTLTELPNRRLLMDRLIQSLIASERSGAFGALLFMDMDNFKILNDTQGHDVGDMLLIEVAKRLKACVRESDTVARLGGDEFVVILQGLGSSELLAANQAEDIAEKIVEALSKTYHLGEHEHHSSVSIGVGLFHGRQITVDELLKRADTAMYQAKSAGRNAVRFFETDMQKSVESRAMLEKELRQALSREELQLYYQVQVNSSRQIIGAEVLLRWINPERGFVSPAQFIPLAEESGLILPIGLWVLETACRQLRQWQDSPETRHLQLAVNVSARQFRQPNFVAQVGEMLERYGFDPSRLKLELTESVVLTDVEETVQKMLDLKKLGVQFSMDDFGTGYSSLSYLKRLPLDQIKIDQSFVRDIVTDKSDAIIVKTIIDMSINFNLEVIAEGVETGEQLEILRQNGCQAFQGYLFGKAVPLAEFEAQTRRSEIARPHPADKFIGADI